MDIPALSIKDSYWLCERIRGEWYSTTRLDGVDVTPGMRISRSSIISSGPYKVESVDPEKGLIHVFLN